MNNNNRAFIKRDQKTKDFINNLFDTNMLSLSEDAYYDQEYYILESEESFHVYSNGTTVLFQDQRLPSFELPLEHVELACKGLENKDRV